MIPDGVVRLHLVGGLELWRLSGEAGGDEAGTSLAMDYFNADPRADLVVSAPGNDHGYENAGAVYILGSRSLWLADGVNGTFDSHMELGRVAAQPKSWKLVGGSAQAEVGRRRQIGDFNGDDHPDLVMSSRDSVRRPVVTVVSGVAAKSSSFKRIGDHYCRRALQQCHGLVARHGGEVVQKLVESVAGFKMLHQDAHGYSRSGKHRSPAKNLGVSVYEFVDHCDLRSCAFRSPFQPITRSRSTPLLPQHIPSPRREMSTPTLGATYRWP